jgi:hypothetical protein
MGLTAIRCQITIEEIRFCTLEGVVILKVEYKWHLLHSAQFLKMTHARANCEMITPSNHKFVSIDFARISLKQNTQLFIPQKHEIRLVIHFFPSNILISELQKFQFRVGDPLNFEPGSLVLHPYPDFDVAYTLPIEIRRETLVWRSCYKDLTLRKSMPSHFATAM